MVKSPVINVQLKPTSLLRSTLAQGAFWAGPVLAVGLSRVWFGGAWVIDVMVLLASLAGFAAIVSMANGKFVALSREQNAAWVAAGMPADVKAWKEANG